jgi:tRNA(Ile)-lysidine synthase
MNLAREFSSFINRHQLIKVGDRLLVAVSGGADSMVLIHLLQQKQISFEAAHVNYNLRGEESLAEETLVQEYCKAHQLKLHILRPDTKKYAAENGISIQMAARELRYDWFRKLCQEQELNLIATAHHADDQAETVMLKLLRGAGPSGLAGIRLKQENLIRPLLCFEKSDLLKWAAEHNIPFRTDSSNLSSDYQRNFIRHEILPLAKKINPGLNGTLLHFAEFMLSHQQFLQYSIKNLNLSFKNPVTGFTHIQTSALSEIPGYDVLLYEMLQPFSVHPSEIENICKALVNSGKQFFTPTHLLTIGRNEIVISPLPAESITKINIESYPFSINTPWGNLHGVETEVPTHFHSPQPNTIYTDPELLQFPLTVRTWKEGDFFHPAGMKGRKKLSDYFTEKKISRPEKNQIPLLFSDDRLVWVCNLRMDQRFTINPSSRRALKITFMPGVSSESVI